MIINIINELEIWMKQMACSLKSVVLMELTKNGKIIF